MKLSDHDKIGMTPDEIALIERADSDDLLAMHGESDATDAADTTADDAADSTQDTADTEAQADDTTEAKSEPAAETKADATPEPVQPEPTPEPAVKPTTYQVPDTDFDAQRKALRAEKRSVEEKWAAGELTDEQKIAELDALDDKLDSLLIETTRANTLREANEQQARQQLEARIQAETAAMAALAKAEAANVAKGLPGIDYATDTLAQQQFDMLFTAVRANPANANMTAAQAVAEANKAVRALRGMGPVAAAPAPAPTPAPAAPRNVPTTLAGIPNAGNAGVKDDLMEQFDRLQGEAQERWLASQPAHVVERLMRQADNAAMQ